MCFVRPSPPPLPDPEPLDSAIEKTADRVVVGDKRKSTKMKNRPRTSTDIGRKRLGTQSLQIPRLVNSNNSSNLNYS